MMAQAAVHIVDGAIVWTSLGGRVLLAACGPVPIGGSCSHARRGMSCLAGEWRTRRGAAGGGAWGDGGRRPCPLAARPRGGHRQELTGAIVAGQQASLVTDAQRALGKLMDEHRTAHIMRALVVPRQL